RYAGRGLALAAALRADPPDLRRQELGRGGDPQIGEGFLRLAPQLGRRARFHGRSHWRDPRRTAQLDAKRPAATLLLHPAHELPLQAAKQVGDLLTEDRPTHRVPAAPGNQSNQPLALLALTPQPRFGTPPGSLGGFAVQVERGVESAALGARAPILSGPTSTTRHRRWWIEKEPRRYRRGPVIHRGGTGSADRVLQPLPGAE